MAVETYGIDTSDFQAVRNGLYERIGKEIADNLSPNRFVKWGVNPDGTILKTPFLQYYEVYTEVPDAVRYLDTTARTEFSVVLGHFDKPENKWDFPNEKIIEIVSFYLTSKLPYDYTLVNLISPVKWVQVNTEIYGSLYDRKNCTLVFRSSIDTDRSPPPGYIKNVEFSVIGKK